MNLVFKPEAEEALFEIASWVEQRNTAGSGTRFIERFIDKIEIFVQPHVVYTICKNAVLAALQLQCISIDKWVIAFTTDKKSFVVHYIIWGPGLK